MCKISLRWCTPVRNERRDASAMRAPPLDCADHATWTNSPRRDTEDAAREQADEEQREEEDSWITSE